MVKKIKKAFVFHGPHIENMFKNMEVIVYVQESMHVIGI